MKLIRDEAGKLVTVERELKACTYQPKQALDGSIRWACACGSAGYGLYGPKTAYEYWRRHVGVTVRAEREYFADANND
jgi:hypothetical protein